MLATSVKQNIFGFDNRLEVSIDFSNATWNTVASHEVFTLTPPVAFMVTYYVSASLASGGAPTIAFGDENNAARYAAAQVHTNLTANVFVNPQATVSGVLQLGDDLGMWDQAKINALAFAAGYDLGYTIAVAAMTGGTILATCCWTAKGAGGSIVEGAGGAL